MENLNEIREKVKKLRYDVKAATLTELKPEEVGDVLNSLRRILQETIRLWEDVDSSLSRIARRAGLERVYGKSTEEESRFKIERTGAVSIAGRDFDEMMEAFLRASDYESRCRGDILFFTYCRGNTLLMRGPDSVLVYRLEGEVRTDD